MHRTRNAAYPQGYRGFESPPLRHPGSDMRKILNTLAAASLIAMTGASVCLAQPAAGAPSMRGDGPPPAARPFSITRSDPALDAVVPRGAKLELLAEGFGLNEGPVWVRNGRSGYLLVS